MNMSENIIVMSEENEYREDEWYGMFYECPSCKRKNITRGDNYCSNCGVQIEWRDPYETENYIKSLHIKAGLKCGKEYTCEHNGQPKIKYGTEAKAIRSAEKMSIKYNKEMEAYPCAFCNDWHIGRKMSLEELKKLSEE